MAKPGLKIAISGKSGCGNTTTSKLLAQTLGLTLINYTFRNLAREKGMELRELCRMAEADEYWDRFLDNRQVELAREGNCVLGSRLAIWLLKDADLKVYFTASAETRAGRVHRRDGGDLEKIIAETAERDHRDRERYLKLYGIDNDDYAFADLVIDTGHRSPEQILEDIMIILKVKKLV